MDFKGIKVLILEGYARQAVPFSKAFRKLGCHVTVLCNSKGDVAYWSKYPNKKIIGVCNPQRYEESSLCICDLIKNDNFDLVVPLVDFSARILSENLTELSKHSKIATVDFSIFEKASDKLFVMETCHKNGIPCPTTVLNASSMQDIRESNLMFPLVVKPRNGYGARDFHIFDNIEELDLFFSNEHMINNYVIQECVPQTDSNIAISIFLDRNSNLKASYSYRSRRWYPLKGGTGTLNELVDRPLDVEMCVKLAKILNLTGLIGFDLIEDKRDGMTKIIEINPRSLACSTIGFYGGINQAKLILQNELTDFVEEQQVIKKRIGSFVRMSQIDFLWFLKSPNRWKAKPSWFNVFVTRDQLFSWADPLPWFAFLFQGLRKYKKDERRKA